MHSSSYLFAAVVGLGALTAAPAYAQTQLDQRCSRAIEYEVLGRYPQAIGVAATALQGRQVSEMETTYSGAGHFEEADGARTTFLFECTSSGRTGQAFGVNIRQSRGLPETAASPRLSSATIAAAATPLGLTLASAASGAAEAAQAVVRGAPAPIEAAPDAKAAVPAGEDVVEAAAGVAELAEAGVARTGATEPVARAVEASLALPQRAPEDEECTPETMAPCTMTPQPATPAAGALVEERAPPPAPRAAADAALAAVAPDMPQGQVALLRFAAQATAAASVCPNMQINNEAILGTVTNVVQAMSMDVSEEEAANRRDTALVAYGVLTGVMLQDAAADQAAFCANAAGTAQRSRSWSFIRTAARN